MRLWGHCVSVTWDIHTPPGSAGAVAIFQLSALCEADLDAALKGLGLPSLPVGRISRRALLDVDDGLVARWSPTCAQLMPHGGPVVVRNLAAALHAAGLPRNSGPGNPLADYPEARTEVEARMLAALSRCSSPRAIDLLLDQPRRWGFTPITEPGITDPALDRVRNRLLRPPLVVAIGHPNVGKSTLVNALAGRRVSITADQPGTTRDHVGVELDLDGLVVHYVDTPGLDARPRGDEPILAEAQSIAISASWEADLILLCGDSASPDPRALLESFGTDAMTLVVGLRADLGLPPWSADICTRDLHRANADEEGLETLVDLIVETLVPRAALHDPRPWRFWE